MNDIKPVRKRTAGAVPTVSAPVPQPPERMVESPNLPSAPTEFPRVPSDAAVEAPSPKKPRRKWGWVAGAAIAGVIGLLVAGYAWYSAQLAAVDPKSHQQIVITLPKGSTAASVARSLKEQGLIKDTRAFEWYVKLTGVSGKLQVGVYRIAKSADTPAIVSKLTTGKTDTFTITFLPGNTLAKHRTALIEAGYTEAEVDAALKKQYAHPMVKDKPATADLEGYIYGETYQMPSDATAEQIIERSLDEFYKLVTSQGLEAKFKQHNLTLHQGIILASIVQREIGSNEKDQAAVAGVFYNRLAKGMNLGSDVTYQYIADKTGVPRDPGLQSDYNTRIHTGLTPGPIASPGKGALLAVANPATHNYIFFLSGDDDVTYFGVTDADHERNIREHCQKKCQIL